MSDTEATPAPTTTVVTLPADTVKAALKQTGHVPGWVTDGMSMEIAPGDAGTLVVTITGDAPQAPAPEPPVE